MTRAAIKHAEERLRDAMLAGDADALAGLLHDDLLFLGPTGAVARKSDDLENYRRARQRMTKVIPRELVIELFGESTGVATVLAELEGEFNGTPFAGTFRYIRTWQRDDDRWQVIAGAVMPSPA